MAFVRNAKNRFVKVDLQNKGSRCLSFEQIRKTGVLEGYIVGLVDITYPEFQTSYYGKMRKMVLVDKGAEDDDFECRDKISLFTRGTVAEKCSDLQKGDIIVLETPFIEKSHPTKGEFHVVADKRFSDIYIWLVKKKSVLLVGKEYEEEENKIVEETEEESQNDTTDIGDSSDLCDDQGTTTAVGKPSSVHKPHCSDDSPNRVTRNSASNTMSKGKNITIASPRVLCHDSAYGSNSPCQSPRVTRSSFQSDEEVSIESPGPSRIAGSKKDSLNSPRVTRIAFIEEKNVQTHTTHASKMVSRSKPSTDQSPRMTRNNEHLASGENTPMQSPRVLRRMKGRETSQSPGNTRSTVTSLQDTPMQSPRVTRSNKFKGEGFFQELPPVRRRSLKNEPPRVTRNVRPMNKNTAEESQSTRNVKDQETTAEASRTGKRQRLRGILSEEDKVQTKPTTSPLPIKRKRFRLAPKGTCSSPTCNNTPEIRNVVILDFPEEYKLIEGVVTCTDVCREKIAWPTERADSGSEVLSINTRKQQRGGKSAVVSTADSEMSQESHNSQVTELQMSSSTSTPSGMFSSKKQNIMGDHVRRTTSPGTPDKRLPLPAKGGSGATPSGTISSHPAVAVGKDIVSSESDEDICEDNEVKQKSKVQSGEDALEHSGDVPQVASDAGETQESGTTIVQDPSVNKDSIPSTSSNEPVSVASSDSGQKPLPKLLYDLPTSYTKICDVKENTMCNLYGVAKFFKPPWKSRGTDMCSVVVLADPSSDELLECVMFKDLALLPQIRKVGDIVRLHRMNIKKYKDKLQALSTKGFSALVFDRDVSIPVTESDASVTTGSFSFEHSEKTVVKTLKEWRMSRQDLFSKAKILTVAEVEPDVYFDIVCQVHGVFKYITTDSVVLRVTDGSEPLHETKNCEDDLSYQVIVSSNSPSKLVPTFDVFLYGEHASLALNLNIKVGTLMLLHNVHSIVNQVGLGAGLLDVLEPALELCMHRGSVYGRGMVVLTPDARDAQSLLQRLKQKTSN